MQIANDHKYPTMLFATGYWPLITVQLISDEQNLDTLPHENTYGQLCQKNKKNSPIASNDFNALCKKDSAFRLRFMEAYYVQINYRWSREA